MWTCLQTSTPLVVQNYSGRCFYTEDPPCLCWASSLVIPPSSELLGGAKGSPCRPWTCPVGNRPIFIHTTVSEPLDVASFGCSSPLHIIVWFIISTLAMCIRDGHLPRYLTTPTMIILITMSTCGGCNPRCNNQWAIGAWNVTPSIACNWGADSHGAGLKRYQTHSHTRWLLCKYD